MQNGILKVREGKFFTKSQKNTGQVSKKKQDCVTQKKAHGRKHFKKETGQGVVITPKPLVEE